MSPGETGRPQRSGPVQEGTIPASARMSTAPGDRAVRPSPGDAVEQDHDGAGEGSGFGADAVPLRPAAERSEEREREERLRLLAGGDRRRRMPTMPHRSVLAIVAVLFAVPIGVVVTRPWSGPAGEPRSAAADRGNLAASEARGRRGAPAVRASVGPARSLASRPGRGAHRSVGGRNGRSVGRHRIRARRPALPPQATGPTGEPTTDSTTIPGPTPPPEPEAVSAPTPPPEPVSTPEPGSTGGATPEPAHGTSSPAGEPTAGKTPSAVERQFGFER